MIGDGVKKTRQNISITYLTMLMKKKEKVPSRWFWFVQQNESAHFEMCRPCCYCSSCMVWKSDRKNKYEKMIIWIKLFLFVFSQDHLLNIFVSLEETQINSPAHLPPVLQHQFNMAAAVRIYILVFLQKNVVDTTNE
jgi:hypothetical protein